MDVVLSGTGVHTSGVTLLSGSYQLKVSVSGMRRFELTTIKTESAFTSNIFYCTRTIMETFILYISQQARVLLHIADRCGSVALPELEADFVQEGQAERE